MRDSSSIKTSVEETAGRWGKVQRCSSKCKSQFLSLGLVCMWVQGGWWRPQPWGKSCSSVYLSLLWGPCTSVLRAGERTVCDPGGWDLWRCCWPSSGGGQRTQSPGLGEDFPQSSGLFLLILYISLAWGLLKFSFQFLILCFDSTVLKGCAQKR